MVAGLTLSPLTLAIGRLEAREALTPETPESLTFIMAPTGFAPAVSEETITGSTGFSVALEDSLTADTGFSVATEQSAVYDTGFAPPVTEESAVFDTGFAPLVSEETLVTDTGFAPLVSEEVLASDTGFAPAVTEEVLTSDTGFAPLVSEEVLTSDTGFSPAVSEETLLSGTGFSPAVTEETAAYATGFTPVTGGGGGTDPSTLSPEWLYDADSLDASLNDGDSVTSWADESGNGYDATGASGSYPVFRPSAKNGHDAVEFDGSDDYLNAPGATTTASWTFLAVIKTGTNSGDGTQAFGWESGNFRGVGWTSGSASETVHIRESGNFYSATNTLDAETWAVVAGRSLSTGSASSGSRSIKGWLNSTAVLTASPSGAGASRTMYWRLGGHSTSNSFGGMLAYAVSFSTAKSDADIEDMITWLKARYAIT